MASTSDSLRLSQAVGYILGYTQLRLLNRTGRKARSEVVRHQGLEPPNPLIKRLQQALQPVFVGTV